MKFELGELVATKAVAETMEQDKGFYNDIASSLLKYRTGDWGIVGKDDWQENENAIGQDERILARYKTSEEDIYIITEWDRSYTTIMFVSEY